MELYNGLSCKSVKINWNSIFYFNWFTVIFRHISGNIRTGPACNRGYDNQCMCHLTEISHSSCLIFHLVILFWQRVNQFFSSNYPFFICRAFDKGASTTNLKSLFGLSRGSNLARPRRRTNALPLGYHSGLLKIQEHTLYLSSIRQGKFRLEIRDRTRDLTGLLKIQEPTIRIYSLFASRFFHQCCVRVHKYSVVPFHHGHEVLHILLQQT